MNDLDILLAVVRRACVFTDTGGHKPMTLSLLLQLHEVTKELGKYKNRGSSCFDLNSFNKELDEKLSKLDI